MYTIRIVAAAALASLGSVCYLNQPVRAQNAPADGSVNPALSDAGDPASGFKAPLGLPRLRRSVLPGESSPIDTSRFAVDGLAAPTPTLRNSLSVRYKKGFRYLRMQPRSSWKRPTRDSKNQPLFVSLLVYGSPDTKINVAGAALRFAESPIRAHLQIEARVPDPRTKDFGWKTVGIFSPVDLYDGAALAAPPVLTVRLDFKEKQWDLFAGMQPVVVGYPLAPEESTVSSFIDVTAGAGGAMICGLVQSSDNPRYEDSNLNGIDDKYEIDSIGKLLPANAAPGKRAESARMWKLSGHDRRAPAMLLERPRPDNP